MSNIVSYRVLIRGLEKLYFKVSLIVLHQRMDGYHKKINHNGNPYDQDIKTPLMEFIETTVEYAIKTNNNDHTKTEGTPQSIQPMPPLQQHYEINPQHVGELSRYFKTRSNGGEMHPPIKDKLEHSVWEHIHATTRCARQGDERNAKLHLNIASSACRELAHYMSDNEHQAFADEVGCYMALLKADNQIEDS
ncbi:MAG: hypothetical protein KAJ92_01915 [Gammaproteobacteria bacterium]|nr:hypothetical protein [Gammaproteobacteria bacterium]MCK5262405.1 hypothetical protein [Gammaproteobacteria bacterium]